MLSKLFHKKITTERPTDILQNSQLWPDSWKIIYFKEYTRFGKITLPKNVLPLKNLKQVLVERKSTREFDIRKEISLNELSTLLYYSVGIKDVPTAVQKNKKAMKRFYPSGGSRYPLETYLVVKRVSEIKPGIYHYNVPDHSLECLLQENELKELDEGLNYAWAKNTAVMCIITAVWDRNFIKYKDFGYNLILIETGHAAQNFLLTAQSLGIRQCSLAGFDNQKINTILDLDENEESALHMVVFGK